MMAPSSHFRPELAGFTLLELLVGMASAAVLMASIVASSMTLQRSFFWSANYAEQSNAELRALDFVTRDVRRARGAYLASGGQVLTLEVPDCYSTYDAQGNPTSPPVNPVIVHAKPEYGDPAQPLVITYYLDGETLTRQQLVTATGQTSNLVIATSIRSFQAQFVGGGNLVRSTVTFRPRLRNDAASENRTAMSATAAARPLRMKYEDTGSP